MRAAFSRSTLRVEAKESRIGRAPIAIPKGVTVTLEGQTLKVKVCRRQCCQSGPPIWGSGRCTHARTPDSTTVPTRLIPHLRHRRCCRRPHMRVVHTHTHPGTHTT